MKSKTFSRITSTPLRALHLLFSVAVAASTSPVLAASGRTPASRDPSSIGIVHPRMALTKTIVTAAAQLGERIHPRFHNLDFDGKTYQYYERKNAAGHVIRQMLIGHDRVEIMNDNNGDGRVESWDIFTAAGKMMFSFPYQDHFSFMDLEIMTTKGIMRYNFAYDKTKKVYSLYRQSGRPYKTFFEKDFIVGCRGGSQDLEMEKLAQSLDTALDNGSMASELKKNLISDALGPGCKAGSFAKQTENLANGMMKIANSEKKDWTVAGSKPKEQGQYLQCLRYYGLDIYASRMEAGFAQYTSIVPTNKSLWKVQCEAGNDVAGSFKEGSGPEIPTITMFENDAAIRKATGKTNPTPAEMADQYSKIFFHEMLHYAGMDENNTHTVADCCADPAAGSGSKACASLKTLTQNASVKQAYTNYIITKMGTDGYGRFIDVVRRAWPNSEGAVKTFDSGLLQLAQSYNDYANSPNCTNKTPTNRLGSCREENLKRAQALIKETYDSTDGSECRRNADNQIGKTDGKKTCELMKQVLLSVAEGGNSTEALKKMCPLIKSKSSPTATAFQWFTGSDAWAADGDLPAILCDIGGNLSTASSPLNFDPPPDSPEFGEHAPAAVAPDSSSASEGNSSLNSSPSHSKTTIDNGASNPYSGPKRPYFSNDSTGRSNEIAKHIKGTDSVFANFQSVAQSRFDLLIPKAQADGDMYQKEATAAQDSRAKGNDFRDGYTVANQKTSIQDPLSSMATASAMGAPVANRGPASVAPDANANSSSGSSQGNGVIAAGVLPDLDAPAQRSAAGLRGGAGANKKTVLGSGGASATADPNFAKANGGADAANPNAVQKRQVDPDEERALEALKAFLQKDDYARVKKDLDRPSVEGALLDHGVQVIDDEGRTYGSGFPEYKFVYDIKKAKLVPDRKLDERSPAARRRK